MNIEDLAKLLSDMTGHKISAINFPAYAEVTDENIFCKLEITSGVEESGGIEEFNIEIMCKASHPKYSEWVANDILKKLKTITNKEFSDGRYQLILCKSCSPQPYFVGESDTHEFVFSVDFRFMVTKIGG